MAIQKYELSLWDTKTQEKKLAIIASDELNSLASAYNINYSINKNGERNLTFSMHYEYIDFDGIKKENPYAKYMLNGARLKLRDGDPYAPIGDTLREQAEYMLTEDEDERWSDYEIIDVQKNSQQFELTITAKELYVNELGRNGWSVVLDTELENNYGTASELGNAVLRGSNWKVSEDSYNPVERITEPLFITQLNKDITVKRATWNGEENILIKKGNYIYPFFSYLKADQSGKWQLNADEIQFLWAGNEKHFTRDVLDDELRVIDDDSIYNYLATKEDLNDISDIVVTGHLEDPFGVHLTGYRIVKQQSTHLCTENDKYVFDWMITDKVKAGVPDNIDKAMSYIETSYSDVAQVSNMINNSSDFKSMAGWEGIYLNSRGQETELKIEAQVFPNLKYNPSEVIVVDGAKKRINYLKLDFSNNQAKIYNKGPSVNALELTKDDVYVIRTRFRWLTEGENYDNVTVLQNNLPSIKFDLIDSKTKTSFGGTTLQCNNIITGTISENNQNVGYPVSTGDSLTYRTEYNGSNLGVTYHDEAGYYYIYFKANSSSDKLANPLYLQMYPIKNPSGGYKLYMEDLQLFKYVKAGISLSLKDKESYETVVFPGDPITSIIKDNEIFFYIDKNDEIQYISSDKSCYEPIYPEGYASVRNLTISKSNYFNNIQEIAELFQIWVKFKVYHDKAGNLLYVDGLPRKEVIFSRYSPNGTVINYAGFKNGINEQSITRVMNSDQIATKVIVSDNNQEYATDGKCSITRANSNISGENTIYNFNYYIEKGLIDEEQLNKDLYGFEEEDIGLYSKMKLLNVDYTDTSKKRQDVQSMYDELDAKLQILDAQVQSLEKQMQIQREQLEAIAKDIDAEDLDKMDYYNSILATYNENVGSYQQTYPQYTDAKTLFESYEQQLKDYDDYLAALVKQKEEITNAFYSKYYQFIREGTWSDDKYMDDELYYLDGLKVSETSAYPKVTYTINVLDIVNAFDDYHEFKFKVGERSYVEDGEFFGYTSLDYNGNTYITPNKIEVIVSECKRVLDNPSTSTITVQNYKNQFEELFQKITAQTQQLQYAAGTYERAANAVLADGSINGASLTSGLANPELSLGANDSFVWNTNNGIVMTNILNTNEKIKLIGSGLFCSDDGGVTWSTGITGSGVSASAVTAGILNVDKVTISSGSTPLFTWNKDGLHAYSMIPGKDQSYINYNQYGLYGTDDVETFEQLLAQATTFQEKLEAIQTYANFSLTWNGLTINDSFGTTGMRMELGPGVFEIKKSDKPDEVIFGIDAQNGTVKFGTSTAGDGGLKITEARLGDNFLVESRGIKTDGGSGNSSMFLYNPGDDIDVECQDVGGDPEHTFSTPACFHINSGFNVNEDGIAYMYAPEITDGIINGALYPAEGSANSDLGGNTTNTRFNYVYLKHNPDVSSTRKIKENIKPIKQYDIDKLEPVEYNLIGEKDKQLGFIAEDIYEICPEVVSLNDKGEPNSITYAMLIPVLVKEIQDLRRRVTELENKNK